MVGRLQHIAGPFFTEGSYTKNSDAEVDRLATNLEAWSEQRWAAVPAAAAVAAAKIGRLQPLSDPIDLQAFMGRWYVAASIPTWFEQGATNCVEDYIWNEEEQFVQVRPTLWPAQGMSGTHDWQRHSQQPPRWPLAWHCISPQPRRTVTALRQPSRLPPAPAPPPDRAPAVATRSGSATPSRAAGRARSCSVRPLSTGPSTPSGPSRPSSGCTYH